MGESTNTILHLLAASQEAELDFTLTDIDALSRKVPNLCKAATVINKYHMEDIHRAGGMTAILGELARGNLLELSAKSVHSESLGTPLQKWDVMVTQDDAVRKFYRAGSSGIPTQTAFSQQTRYNNLDLDRKGGCIRDIG